MAEFNVRSDSVDVEQIMRQIRARIREKRGADYTEAELQQLASVKLEKFLDPRGVRSDLVDQFRRHRVVSPEPPKYEFEDTTLYETHRGPLRFIRKLLHPILKLFINPNPLIHALHVQKQVNDEFHKRFRAREEMDPLYYEVVHNLVVEVTRLGIEVHNLKMRVESLSSRLDFDERRSRSLEGVVQYRQVRQAPTGRPGRHEGRSEAPAPAPPQESRGAAPAPQEVAPASASVTAEAGNNAAAGTEPRRTGGNGPGQSGQGPRPEGGGRRRRRRRRRRRPGQTLADRQGGGAPSGAGADSGHAEPAHDADFDDGPDDGADDDGGAADQ